jgi:hypothetical protein
VKIERLREIMWNGSCGDEMSWRDGNIGTFLMERHGGMEHGGTDRVGLERRTEM